MTTRILKVSTVDDAAIIADAVATLRSGGNRGIPDRDGVRPRGGRAKPGRSRAEGIRREGAPSDNPLIVHLASPDQMEEFGLNISTTGQLASLVLARPTTR